MWLWVKTRRAWSTHLEVWAPDLDPSQCTTNPSTLSYSAQPPNLMSRSRMSKELPSFKRPGQALVDAGKMNKFLCLYKGGSCKNRFHAVGSGKKSKSAPPKDTALYPQNPSVLHYIRNNQVYSQFGVHRKLTVEEPKGTAKNKGQQRRKKHVFSHSCALPLPFPLPLLFPLLSRPCSVKQRVQS